MNASTVDSGTAHASSEVLEEHAEGDLKGIFQDIKGTLRIPVVGALFGTLATQPDYLRVAWRQLHTNAQTVYFESQADVIRRYAVAAMSDLGETRTPADAEGIAPVLRVFHYANPKLLLAVSALRSSMVGQTPRVIMLSGAEKRQVVAGIPNDMPSIELIDLQTRDERLQSLLADIASTSSGGVITSDYRALAQWPDFLQAAWAAVKPRMVTPDYRAVTRRLRWMADEAVLGFPFRMEITPHTLRHAGLTEGQIDTVRTMLGQYYRALAEAVANVAVFTTGIEGRSGAMENRFPVELV